MLKKTAGMALICLLVFFTVLLKAEEKLPYELIVPPQPVANPAKIEVIEFFWYGCPHCYSFEPTLTQWIKTKPANVEFIRIPAVFSEQWGKHAKAFYTAEALGVLDAVHADFFDAIQEKKQKLDNEEELAKFFAAHGVKESDFKEAYNSFAVDTKVRQAPAIAAKYGISGVPAVIVNGKYKTDGPLAGSQENIIGVINTLVSKEGVAK